MVLRSRWGFFSKKLGKKTCSQKKQNKTKKIKGGKEKPCWNILTLKLSFSGYQKITGEGGCHRGPKISRRLNRASDTHSFPNGRNCTVARTRLWMLQRDRYPGYVYCIFVQPQNGHFRYLRYGVFTIFHRCFLDIVDTLGWHLQRFRGISYRRAFMLTKFSHSPVHNTSFPYGMTLQRTLGKTHQQSWLYFNNTSPSSNFQTSISFSCVFKYVWKSSSHLHAIPSR